MKIFLMDPGFYAAKKTLKKIKILATSVYKFSLSAMMNLVRVINNFLGICDE